MAIMCVVTCSHCNYSHSTIMLGKWYGEKSERQQHEFLSSYEIKFYPLEIPQSLDKNILV